MKNHIKVGGKLLQTNKKWSHLKQKQKESIAALLRKLYINFVSDNGRKPNKEEKETILEDAYSVILEKEIWIPKGEVKKYFCKKIMKYDKQLRSHECKATESIEEEVINDPVARIKNDLFVLKNKQAIKDFSMEGKEVKIAFNEHKKTAFVKPSFNEREAMDAIKTFNASTIKTLNCIIEEVSSNNEFPTQKYIADAIGKNATTVCKCMAKLKSFNLIYKNQDGKFALSEMSKITKEKVVTIATAL